MFRHSLIGLLQADGDVQIVGDARRGEEAIALAEELKPDLVIMEVDQDAEKAKDELESILTVSPSSRVVILSMYDDPRFVHRVLGMGPSAYVHKSSSVEQLLGIVRSTALSSDNESAIVSVPERMLEQVQNAAGAGLSARELEILVWVARGSSNRQIATELNLSDATVKRHLANTYPKIGVSSRFEAVSVGLSEGWILSSDITAGEGS
jgi:DNA-binding NarL/FixJ family response regulator